MSRMLRLLMVGFIGLNLLGSSGCYGGGGYTPYATTANVGYYFVLDGGVFGGDDGGWGGCWGGGGW